MPREQEWEGEEGMTLVERVAQWPKEWLAQGREEGREEGLEHERALLCRQAASRFGADTSRLLSAALARVADPDRLADIGEWLVRCETGEEFPRPGGARRGTGGVAPPRVAARKKAGPERGFRFHTIGAVEAASGNGRARGAGGHLLHADHVYGGRGDPRPADRGARLRVALGSRPSRHAGGAHLAVPGGRRHGRRATPTSWTRS